PARWADDLEGLLRQLPRDFRYGVELRNRELLTDAYGAVLARHGVAHVFNSWTEMPTIGEQLELPWTFPAPFTVARALLRPGRRYADAVKLFEPYDRIRDPQPELRQDLLRLVAEALRRRIEALILVNNRLEGNAPGTIRALVDALTGARPCAAAVPPRRSRCRRRVPSWSRWRRRCRRASSSGRGAGLSTAGRATCTTAAIGEPSRRRDSRNTCATRCSAPWGSTPPSTSHPPSGSSTRMPAPCPRGTPAS